jgi:hypothetical protein
MNSQIYPNDFREYFARKYGMQIFFFLGFSFMVSVFFIIPGSSASSLSQRFLMQLSGLVVGLSLQARVVQQATPAQQQPLLAATPLRLVTAPAATAP